MAPGFTSDAALDTAYGEGAAQRVRDARVLVVGAGGVGCELVKNLACAGFGSITMIDLDTIDVSNLNRQFLFRKHHVGKSKAAEAASTITRMVPRTNVKGIVGNIKEPRFGISFYKDFTLVCNALDNLEARRHVNRMCLAAEVPLVESGSTGYSGQTQVIGKGFECYDCKDKPKQKSYAVCTIRSTPEKPVHCVVWAKYLFDLVFGPDDDGNVLKDLDSGTTSASNAENGNATTNGNGITSPEANCKQEANGNIDNKENVRETENSDGNVPKAAAEGQIEKRKQKASRMRYAGGESAEEFAARVCTRVFVDDIKAQIAMKDLWKERAPPSVLHVSAVADSNAEDIDKVNLLSQDAWTKEKSSAVFKSVIKRIVDDRSTEIGALTFDKDDRDAMMFVSAASNLRAYAYAVPLQSPFAVMGIAGNIVHAIATTNAMVGGLIVLEALKITANKGNLDKCFSTYVVKLPSGSRVRKVLNPESLKPPNRECFVCSKGQLHLTMDVKSATLQTLVQLVLQKRLSVLQPTVHVTTGDFHNTIYESGEGLEDDEIEMYRDNLKKKLKELRVEDGSQLLVEDFAQNFSCTVHINDAPGRFDGAREEEPFLLDGKVPEKRENGTLATTKDQEVADVDEDDALWVPAEREADQITTSKSTLSASDKYAGDADKIEVMEVETVEAAGRKRGLSETANGEATDERDIKRARGTVDLESS